MHKTRNVLAFLFLFFLVLSISKAEVINFEQDFESQTDYYFGAGTFTGQPLVNNLTSMSTYPYFNFNFSTAIYWARHQSPVRFTNSTFTADGSNNALFFFSPSSGYFTQAAADFVIEGCEDGCYLNPNTRISFDIACGTAMGGLTSYSYSWFGFGNYGQMSSILPSAANVSSYAYYKSGSSTFSNANCVIPICGSWNTYRHINYTIEEMIALDNDCADTFDYAVPFTTYRHTFAQYPTSTSNIYFDNLKIENIYTEQTYNNLPNGTFTIYPSEQCIDVSPINLTYEIDMYDLEGNTIYYSQILGETYTQNFYYDFTGTSRSCTLIELNFLWFYLGSYNLCYPTIDYTQYPKFYYPDSTYYPYNTNATTIDVINYFGTKTKALEISEYGDTYGHNTNAIFDLSENQIAGTQYNSFQMILGLNPSWQKNYLNLTGYYDVKTNRKKYQLVIEQNYTDDTTKQNTSFYFMNETDNTLNLIGTYDISNHIYRGILAQYPLIVFYNETADTGQLFIVTGDSIDEVKLIGTFAGFDNDYPMKYFEFAIPQERDSYPEKGWNTLFIISTAFTGSYYMGDWQTNVPTGLDYLITSPGTYTATIYVTDSYNAPLGYYNTYTDDITIKRCDYYITPPLEDITDTNFNLIGAIKTILGNPFKDYLNAIGHYETGKMIVIYLFIFLLFAFFIGFFLQFHRLFFSFSFMLSSMISAIFGYLLDYTALFISFLILFALSVAVFLAGMFGSKEQHE